MSSSYFSRDTKPEIGRKFIFLNQQLAMVMTKNVWWKEKCVWVRDYSWRKKLIFYTHWNANPCRQFRKWHPKICFDIIIYYSGRFQWDCHVLCSSHELCVLWKLFVDVVVGVWLKMTKTTKITLNSCFSAVNEINKTKFFRRINFDNWEKHIAVRMYVYVCV